MCPVPATKLKLQVVRGGCDREGAEEAQHALVAQHDVDQGEELLEVARDRAGVGHRDRDLRQLEQGVDGEPPPGRPTAVDGCGIDPRSLGGRSMRERVPALLQELLASRCQDRTPHAFTAPSGTLPNAV